MNCRIGRVVKVFALRGEDPWFDFHLSLGHFSGLTHSSDLKKLGQLWDWFVRCQYTVTGWGRNFDLQLLYQCGST